MNKCLFRLYPFQELPLATGSFSGTIFSDLILFRMCLARLDPFQKLWCQIFFLYSCLSFILLCPNKSTIETAHARRLSPPDSMSTAGLWLNYSHFSLNYSQFSLNSCQFDLNYNQSELQLVQSELQLVHLELQLVQSEFQPSNCPLGLGFLMATFFFVFGTLFGRKKVALLNPFRGAKPTGKLPLQPV